MTWLRSLLGFAVATAAACAPAAEAPPAAASESDFTRIKDVDLAPGESVLMLLGTNDIHGSFDRLPQLAGYVTAAKAHLASTYGTRASLLVLDAGDATQGTLVSNYSEGLLAIRAMNAVGYTAAVAGNHGFDFGPVDWKKDQCLATDVSCDPLDALERSVASATFPFLGANVVDRASGKTLAFLPPYTLVPHQGRNVAVIGLENHFTDRTTIPENVAKLRFGDGKKEIADIVEDLYGSGKADVFVLVMHEGDADTKSMGDFLASLPRRSDGEPLVAAAIAGHSHRINDDVAADIPYVQSGANGEMFGVVELVTKKGPTGRLSVVREKMQKRAAIPIAEHPSSFLGEPVRTDDHVRDIVLDGEREVAPIANERLANAPRGLSRDNGRIADSPIGNLLADTMRTATGADVAMINGGDVRADFAPGDVLYENLFQVLPKNLALVTIDAMPTAKLVEQVMLAVKSCGRRGALQVSGVRLVFTRDCSKAVNGEDPSAALIAILDVHGDAIVRNGAVLKPTVKVATTDFVMSGGAGYDRFVGLATNGASLVLRDTVATGMKTMGTIDANAFASGRYVDCTASPTRTECR